MNKLLTVFLSLLLSGPLMMKAQQKAVTESGDEVLLFDDGTWRYSEGKVAEMTVDEVPLTINSIEYSTPNRANAQIKSKRCNYAVNYDKKEWTYKNSVVNTQAEYQLEMQEGDLYGLMICEAIEIPLESLRDIALLNARSAAPDTKLLIQEMRTVNGMEVLYLEFEATLKGIKFHYFNCYASNEGGSVQLLTYTASNLAEKYRKTAEKLLNGLEMVE